MNYPLVTIEVDTVIGEDENLDKKFFEYLEEYSISYKIGEDKGSGWPSVEYTGGPIALSNMLKERFGFSIEDIDELFPDIKKSKNV
jgi:hypothetical protein